MNLGKPILEELFNKQIRFRIPVFQRHYVWNEQDQLIPLWDDFLNKYHERLNKHKNLSGLGQCTSSTLNHNLWTRHLLFNKKTKCPNLFSRDYFFRTFHNSFCYTDHFMGE